jgi:hypothetical protein
MAQDPVDPPVDLDPVDLDRLRRIAERIEADKIRCAEFLRDHPRSPMPQDYGLHDFLTYIIQIARAGEDDQKRLSKYDRDLLRRHRELFARSVSYLDAILTEGQSDREREFRRNKLWQALGSVSIITSYQTLTPATERRQQKLSSSGAATKRSRTQRIDDIIVPGARPFWLKHPSYNSSRVADAILPTMDAKLAPEDRLKKRALAKHLDKLRPRIFS